MASGGWAGLTSPPERKSRCTLVSYLVLKEVFCLGGNFPTGMPAHTRVLVISSILGSIGWIQTTKPMCSGGSLRSIPVWWNPPAGVNMKENKSMAACEKNNFKWDDWQNGVKSCMGTGGCTAALEVVGVAVTRCWRWQSREWGSFAWANAASKPLLVSSEGRGRGIKYFTLGREEKSLAWWLPNTVLAASFWEGRGSWGGKQGLLY